MINIENLKPFPKFCWSIGMIPTSYKVSLTYEEQLLWFCDFLENTVIPTVNNNGQAVEELQNLFVTLTNYVNNYFDNLDVQEEINNKLDEMVENGTLQEIITNYLNTKAIFCYDNVNEMKQASNLINGSYAQTLGYYSKNDGGGALYKITNEIESNEIQETLNNGLYASLTDINKNGYIDVRWLGADSTGVNNSNTAFQTAINYSNSHYSLPIKIIGSYLITDTINITGALNMFGMHNNSRLLINQTEQTVVKKAISRIKIADNITAFNLIGEGTATSQAAAVYLKNIEFLGNSIENLSKVIDVQAYGAPSRPSYIKECEIHHLDTFIYSNANIHPNIDGTCMYNLEICNCNFYDIKYAMYALSSSKSTFGGLNIHDNVMEQSNGMLYLQKLFGENIINNNLMEKLIGTTVLNVNRGALTFNNNYFEVNNNTINIYSSSSDCYLIFDTLYVFNSANMKININDIKIRSLPRNCGNIILKNTIMPQNVLESVRETLKFKNIEVSNIFNAPISVDSSLFNTGKKIKSLFPSPANTTLVTIGENESIPYLIPVNVRSGISLYGDSGNYTPRVAGQVGDKVAILLWKPRGIVEELYIVDSSQNLISDLNFGNQLDGEGFFVITATLTQQASSGAVLIKATNGVSPKIAFINLGQDGNEYLVKDYAMLPNFS